MDFQRVIHSCTFSVGPYNKNEIMRTTIRQKNLSITPSLRSYIEKKIILPVRKLFEEVSAADFPILDLEFARTTRHHRKGKVYYAEATLTIGKTVLRAEVDDEDIRAACDILHDALAREILRFKGRTTAQNRRVARQAKKERYASEARLYRKGRIREEGS